MLINVYYVSLTFFHTLHCDFYFLRQIKESWWCIVHILKKCIKTFTTSLYNFDFFLSTTDLKKNPTLLSCDWGKSEEWNRRIQNICVILNFPALNFLNKGGIQLLFRNCVNYDSFATLVAIKSRNQQCKTFAVIFYIR